MLNDLYIIINNYRFINELRLFYGFAGRFLETPEKYCNNLIYMDYFIY